MCKPAPKMSHHRLCELDQPRGDATPVHQLSGKHEERNGHQREAVHAVIDIAVKQCHVALLTIQPEQHSGRRKERKKDGQSDKQQDQKCGEKPDQHQAGSFSPTALSAPPATTGRSLSPPPKLVTRARRISSIFHKDHQANAGEQRHIHPGQLDLHRLHADQEQRNFQR